MDLLVILQILTIIFATSTTILSIREKRAKKGLEEKEQQLSKKLYEINTITNLSKEIGYSFDISGIVEQIINKIESVFFHTSISYVLIYKDNLRLKMKIKDPVGKNYLEKVKNNILNAVYSIEPDLKNLEILETFEGKVAPLDQSNLESFFNVPLIIDKKILAIINIASNKKYTYKREDMIILYNIVKHSVFLIEKIQSIIETEKGRLNSLLSSISTGAIMLSIKNDVMELSAINTAARDFLGLETDATTYKVLTSFGPNVDIQSNMKKVLEEKSTSIIENVKIKDKFFKIYVNPIFLYGSGKIIGVSITMQNMTLEKQIQEIRETFTHMVVHELRAPLTSIKGASELLLSGRLSEEEKGKMLELIKDSTIRMLSEISDLLDASKIEAGRFEITREEANINELIKQRVQIFQHMAQQKLIDLTTSLDDSLPLFDFDQERIGQVLNNLLSNSVKYTHQGGKIDVKSAIEDNFCKVTLTDNGIGIPKEKQITLFTKYKQAGQEGFKTGSTGLGLYISKSIVESHNGRIGLVSEDGRGTQVYFLIPLIHEKKKPQSASEDFLTHRVIN